MEVTLVADVEVTAIMVAKSSIHVYVASRSLSRVALVVHTLPQSQDYKLIALLKFGDVVLLKIFSQIPVMVLESKCLRRTKLLVFQEL